MVKSTSASCLAIRILTAPVLLLSSADSIARNLCWGNKLRRKTMLDSTLQWPSPLCQPSDWAGAPCEERVWWEFGKSLLTKYLPYLPTNVMFYLEKSCFEDWAKLLFSNSWKKLIDRDKVAARDGILGIIRKGTWRNRWGGGATGGSHTLHWKSWLGVSPSAASVNLLWENINLYTANLKSVRPTWR